MAESEHLLEIINPGRTMDRIGVCSLRYAPVFPNKATVAATLWAEFLSILSPSGERIRKP